MTAKEYLEQIGKLDKKIKAMKMRSEEYDRLSLSIPGQDFSRERVDHTPNYEAPFVKWIIKKHDLDVQIKELEEQLKNLQAEALLKIESLDNEDYKNVLMMRYVKNMDLNEVAKYLFISLSTAKRWHRDALDSLIV